MSLVIFGIFLMSAWSMPAQAQGLPNLGDTEREELSPALERRLGEQIMRQIRRNRDYLDDAPTQEYLSNLGNVLLATRPDARGEAQYDYFFFVVRDPMLNAFALPGGFIGAHTGLILAAQNESEVAAVMAHEIGHVAQRHIARMLGKQRQDMLIPLAGMILGALAASSSPDAGIGIMMGSQGLAMQRQLNFSREAEREADRIGLDIMRDAGYETAGMINFFGRLQQATRGYNDTMPAYLRSHPLTSERIADIQARTRDLRYRQRADGFDFPVIQARVRVLQTNSTQGLVEAEETFKRQIQQNTRTSIVAGNYGLAMVALRRGNPEKAQTFIDQARAVLKDGVPKTGNAALTSLAIDVRLAARQATEAVAEADIARKQFPLSRGMVLQYADALMAANRMDEAVSFLRDQTSLYRSEPQLFDRLAKAYAAQGKQALQHMALAENYALRGSLPAAIDQLGIARRAPDASFYDHSIIDAREREMKAERMEELKREKEGTL